MFWRRLALSLSLPAVMLISLIVVTVTLAQQPPQKGYISELVTEDELIYRIYTYSETLTLDLSDLELWSDIVGKDPIGMIYWQEPDFRLILLQEGLARLRNESSASEQYVSAQNQAQADGLGMWFVPPTSTPTVAPSPTWTRTPTPRPELTATPTSQPMPTSTATPSPTPSIGEMFQGAVSNIPWDRVGRTAIAVIGFLGAIEFMRLIVSFYRRHRVTLIILGEKSTGKTWLWTRLKNKNAKLTDMPVDNVTTEVEQHRLGMITMGDYKIYPKLVDLPGRPESTQADWLIDNRRLHFLRRLSVRQKRVWIIVLATTQQKTATRDSAESIKINTRFMDQQLGYLALPMGLLGAKGIRRPECVVVCVAKVDLFMTHDPQLNPSDPALERLAEMFGEHIRRVKTDCAHLGIPFVHEFVSAKEGWGRASLMEAIQSALYGPGEDK